MNISELMTQDYINTVVAGGGADEWKDADFDLYAIVEETNASNIDFESNPEAFDAIITSHIQ